jgi:hypothetical protein
MAAAWPVVARAQQPGQMRRIAVLAGGAEGDAFQEANLAALWEGLAKVGWVAGRNLRIDLRFAAGDLDRIRAYAAELARSRARCDRHKFRNRDGRGATADHGPSRIPTGR